MVFPENFFYNGTNRKSNSGVTFGGNIMAKLARLRWASWAALLVFLVLLLVCEIHKWWFWEAFVLIGLLCDLFFILVKTRCPHCKGLLPLLPPLFGNPEYCRHCGSQIQ